VQDLSLDRESTPRLQEGVVAASVFVHQSVERTATRFYSELRRPTYVTPTSYLELLNTFQKLLLEKRTSIETTRSRLAVGLDKLFSTAEQVAHMQVRLRSLLLLRGWPVVLWLAELSHLQLFL
jgi:dynein heavy chain